MAFPSVVGAAALTTYGSNDSNPRPYNLPAGITAGELLVLLFSQDGSATPSTPGGWTSMGTFPSSGNASTLTVFVKLATGSEGATVNITGNALEQQTAIAFRVTDWAGSVATGVAVSTNAQANSANPDPNGLTPSWGALDTLWLAVASYNGAATRTAYPSNYTYFQATQDGAGGGGSAGTAVGGRQLNAATEDPGAFSLSGATQWAAVTIAVSPVTTPPIAAQLKRWDGAAWVDVTSFNVFDGANFVPATLKYWDGASWVEVNTT